MNYPYPCIAGFRLTFGEEEFISLIKPEAAFKFHEKKTTPDNFFTVVQIWVWKAYYFFWKTYLMFGVLGSSLNDFIIVLIKYWL